MNVGQVKQQMLTEFVDTLRAEYEAHVTGWARAFFEHDKPYMAEFHAASAGTIGSALIQVATKYFSAGYSISSVGWMYEQQRAYHMGEWARCHGTWSLAEIAEHEREADRKTNQLIHDTLGAKPRASGSKVPT